MIFLLIINISLLIFSYRNIFSVMVRAYLVINFISIINPGLILFFFNLAHNRYIPETDNYNLALIYNFFYNILVVFGYKVFFQIQKPSLLISNFLKEVKNRVAAHKNSLIKANLYAYIISLICNSFLFLTGNFRMNESVIGYSGPFLQILKSISSVNFLSIILFSQIRYYSEKIDKKFNYLYAGISFFSVYFAIQSGSRAQLIINLFVISLGYWKEIKKNLKLTIFILIFSFPFFIILFPLISSFRNSGYDLSQTFILLSTKLNSQSITDTVAEVFIGRFNYLQTLSRVIYQVNNFGPEGSDIYLNNIIGLIPRVIWPNKPLISDFGVETGYLLEMINEIDFDSSLGLGVSAEAYYRLGYYGLLIAIVQSYIFSFFSKNFFVKRNILSMSIFIFFIVTILLRDGYFALIPGLIWDFITCLIFIFFLILFTKKSTKSFSKV